MIFGALKLQLIPGCRHCWYDKNTKALRLDNPYLGYFGYMPRHESAVDVDHLCSGGANKMGDDHGDRLMYYLNDATGA